MDVIWLAVGLYFLASGDILVDHSPTPFATEAQCREAVASQEAKIKSNTRDVLGYALSCVAVKPVKNEPHKTKDGKPIPDAPRSPLGHQMQYVARS